MSNIYILSFRADGEYSKLKDIKLHGFYKVDEKSRGKGSLKENNELNEEECCKRIDSLNSNPQFIEYLLEEVFKDLQGDVNKDDGRLIVGLSDDRMEELKRRRKKFQLITIFDYDEEGKRNENDEDDYVPEKRLNGIVGVLRKQIRIQTSYFDDEIKRTFDKCTEKPWPVNVEVQIQIKSRFDETDNAYFLATLLTYGKNISPVSEGVFESNDFIFDFLLATLLDRSLGEAMLKGYYRKYERFDNNDAHIRGSINVERHIQLNHGLHNGRVAYEYRENTVNNSLNAMVLYSYEYLKKKYPFIVTGRNYNNIESFYNDLKYSVFVDKYDAKRLLLENMYPISHPYFHEYEQVRLVCFRILRDEGMSIFDASTGSTSGFVYYVPDLWEEFLERVFNEIYYVTETDSKISLMVQNRSDFFQKNQKDEYLTYAKPDFVFDIKDKEDNKKTLLIMDAKFKRQWESVLSGTEISASCVNDVNKCIRDMIVFEAKAAGTVFPVNNRKCKIPVETTAFAELDGQEQRNLIKGMMEEQYSKNNYARKISPINTQNSFYLMPFNIFSIDGLAVKSYQDWLYYFRLAIEAFKECFCKKVLDDEIASGSGTV